MVRASATAAAALLTAFLTPRAQTRDCVDSQTCDAGSRQAPCLKRTAKCPYAQRQAAAGHCWEARAGNDKGLQEQGDVRPTMQCCPGLSLGAASCESELKPCGRLRQSSGSAHMPAVGCSPCALAACRAVDAETAWPVGTSTSAVTRVPLLARMWRRICGTEGCTFLCSSRQSAGLPARGGVLAAILRLPDTSTIDTILTCRGVTGGDV